jgi:hypothetical protein
MLWTSVVLIVGLGHRRKGSRAIPLVRQKRHSLGAGTFNHVTATSGVKVAQHPQGLTLMPAQGGGALKPCSMPSMN